MEDRAINERARLVKAMCFVNVGYQRRYLKLGQTKIRVEGSMDVNDTRYNDCLSDMLNWSVPY